MYSVQMYSVHRNFTKVRKVGSSKQSTNFTVAGVTAALRVQYQYQYSNRFANHRGSESGARL